MGFNRYAQRSNGSLVCMLHKVLRISPYGNRLVVPFVMMTKGRFHFLHIWAHGLVWLWAHSFIYNGNVCGMVYVYEGIGIKEC